MQPLEQPIAIMEKAYKNLGYVLLLLIPLTGIAFYKTYFNQFPGFAFEENITPYIHLHAFIASVWIAMLIAQPLLIRNKKMAWHRKIGRLSYVVFPLLLLSFLPQMIRLAHSEHPEFLFFPLGDSVLLVLFYALAIYYRKNPPRHMRYMIGTAIVFLGPTIGRIGPLVLGLSEGFTQNLQYGLIFSILIALILSDRRHGKNFRPYLWIGLGWVFHMVGYYLVF